jgi:NADP-dependent 3-hydroxy acid dehydrogenase YdfG
MGPPSSQRLAGTVALVTGAGTGIGEAAADALAEAGASLVLVGRRRALLETAADRARARGVEAMIQALDVTDGAAVESCLAATLARYRRLDLLVHAAGMNTKRRSLRNLEPAEWRRVVDVNLTGAYLVVRAVLPVFREAGRGSVILVGSDSGLTVTEGAGAAYCASKFGVTALVHAINVEERHHGIRATAIQAGEVDTPILEDRPVVPAAEIRRFMLRSEDVAAAIVYAATQPARVAVEQIVVRPTLDAPSDTAARTLGRWNDTGA